MPNRLMQIILAIASLVFLTSFAHAEDVKPSTCHAVAKQLDDDAFALVQFASFAPKHVATQSAFEVAISFQGHSTYLIETGAGVKIATDYSGFIPAKVVPDVVTMNQAHSTHYTSNPDPRIAHVLRGWDPGGGVAEHYLTVDDVLIRNVTTDIMRYGTVPDGNSIFIFETAGLCIGHLGHLHHKLSDEHLAKIGRLDVVMVPVDGGLTLTHTSVKELLDRLRSSVVLPMHVRSGGAVPRFLAHLGEQFEVEFLKENKIVLSLNNLPAQPTVKILPGVSYYPEWGE